MSTEGTTYCLRLDFPPSVNHYYRRNGHVMHLSEAGRKYLKSVKSSFAEHQIHAPIKGRIAVSIELSRKDRRKYDIQNYDKSLLDALIGLAYEDDGQIDKLEIRRLPVDESKNGFADVTITEL
jgi:crossover junction endodeoxyribonuclease RusA